MAALAAPGNWLEEVNQVYPCPCSISLSQQGQDWLDSTNDWSEDHACPLFGSWFSKLTFDLLNGCENFHPGAVGCIRSAKTEQGAGQQCCYGVDGVLIDPDTAEGRGAGTPDKVWAGGFIAGLFDGHWPQDVDPYNWCCKECKDDSRCKKYYQGARKLDVAHCKA